MRIGRIITVLRGANTYFGTLIGGAAEFEIAVNNTLSKEIAFVMPLIESATPNEHDNGLGQYLTERFAVVVALKNDTSNTKKLGVVAYDKLHDIREQLFNNLLNLQIQEAYTTIMYRGGRLMRILRSYMWYQFEFEYMSLIGCKNSLDNGKDVYGIIERPVSDEDPVDLNKIYTNVIQAPSTELPYTGDLPLPDGFPDVTIPDIAWYIDENDNPELGAFQESFQTAFDINTED
jgi:hypothetical protein